MTTGGGFRVSGIEGDLTLRDSTFSENTAFYGGGVYVVDVDGTTLIENATISGNSANYDGGGIYFGYLYDDQETTIRNSTIVDNSAGSNPGLYAGPYGGGGVFLYDDCEDTTAPIAENGPVTISSTIVANNTVTGPAVEGPDLLSQDFADGFNVDHSLIENTSGATITGANNITGTDPDLGSLQDNGGPTETLLPNLTSPVIDAGVANGLTTDQRGLPRTFDPVSVPNKNGSDGTDIGATELQAGENGLPGNGECQGAVVPSQTATDSGSVLTGTEGSDQLIGAGGRRHPQRPGRQRLPLRRRRQRHADGGDGNDLISGERRKRRRQRRRGQGSASPERAARTAKRRAGKDKLTGGGGKDKLKGSGGKDKVSGGAGKDKINPGNGKDKVKAGRRQGQDQHRRRQEGQAQLRRRQGQGQGRRQGQGVKANCDVVKVKGA